MSQQVPSGSFRILERDQERRPIPAGARPEYVPVTYLVPWERNQAALGYDNLSEPVRRAATERVRASRQLAVAAPLALVQEDTRHVGMLEMLPVEDLKTTDAAGRPRLLGFVVGVVRIDQLIALATQGKIPDGLRLRVSAARDQTVATSQSPAPLAGEAVLYPPVAEPGPPVLAATGAQWQGPLRVGDQVLVELTQRVRHRLRASDILARWGGEEFVVLLPHCDREQAVSLAEKLRRLIAAEPFPAAGAMTASFGVAAYRAEETLATWIQRVDEALYAAKAGGRDQVRLAG